MAAKGIHSLVIALATAEHRRDAASSLAKALGFDALALFVRDPAVGVLLPAPGMAKTFSGGAQWRALLAACATPGRHEARVDLPLGASTSAVALSCDGLVAVLLGGTAPDPELDVLVAELPLLAALIRVEQALKIDLAQAAGARADASRAHALARALDAARAASAGLNLQLRREHERKDEFLAMLAHELRNPLAPLVNSIGILRRVDLSSELAKKQVDVMERQLGQMTRLVNDLLDVSRVSRGLIELRREAIPLAEVIDAAVEAVRPGLDGQRHALQTRGLEASLYVNGDRVRLIQVFANLLQNAVKYTPVGGSIDISVIPDGARASVVVHDNGIGIPQEMLSRVFDLFTQVPIGLDRAQGGLGIGLTLVRTLVELHGGRVSAHSVGLGHGSTFTVSLPLVAAPVPPKQHDPREERAPANVKVLVVDDSLDNAESLAEVLRMMGVQAQIASSGPEALECALKNPPDMVLLDIGLPGMDGYETARRLRSQARAPVKLVALTGYGSADDRERARMAGFDEHIVKPISVTAIEKLLGGFSPQLA